MFRPLKGFKAQCHEFTILIASDFDEYRVLIEAPGSIVQGRRQFTEAQAKEHGRAMAASYLKEKNPDLPMPALEWVPFQSSEWLTWNP